MAFVRILREAINDFLANMFLVIFFFIRISCIYNCIFCVCLYLRGAIDLLLAFLSLVICICIFSVFVYVFLFLYLCRYLRGGAIDLLVAHLFLILVKKECLTYVGLQMLYIAGITFLREPEH